MTKIKYLVPAVMGLFFVLTPMVYADSDCTGGTITHVGGNTIHTFTSSGTFDCTGASVGSVSALVVGGGAGGGSGVGGGGGAGGLLTEASHSISASSYAVTVGAGGAPDMNGGNSSFDTMTAIGGGTGGTGDGVTEIPGASGGSGGGGAPIAGPGGAGTPGQGYAGGTGSSDPNGTLAEAAGGGGSGSIGQDGIHNTKGGDGGFGTTSSISGVSVMYAGGGGGNSNGAGVGGTGKAGGGDGGQGGHFAGYDAAANSGSGGGGGNAPGYNPGGSGGSGIVIVSYPTPPSTLVAYWKMDGNSNDSVGANNGVDHGVTYSLANGRINQGAAFGNGVRMDIGPVLSGPVNLSAAAWIKTSDVSDEQVIIQQRAWDPFIMHGEWIFELHDGKLAFYAGGDGNGTYDLLTGNASVADGKWHHVGVAQNGNTYTFYIDGALDASVTSGTAVSYQSDLTGSIGYDERDYYSYANMPRFFNGPIDEVRVYNGTLSASDFSDLYALATSTPNHLLTALSPAKVWVGLKNSDDVGTKFDLQAEVYADGNLIGSGATSSVAGGSSGFNNAKLDTIPLTLNAPVPVPSGTNLSVKVYVRNACVGSGHNSGTARLWYSGADANTSFGDTVDAANNTYYLRNGFTLASSTGSAKQTIDVAAGAKCSAFKLFGTWSTVVQ